MILNDKLDNFYTSVIDSATAKSIEIIDEYKKTLQKTRDERIETARKRSKNTYQLEKDHIIREKNRKLSNDTFAIRRKVQDRTAELTDQIFKEVEQKILEYMKTSSYQDYLKVKIKGAIDFARGDEIIIYINPSDEALIPILEQETGIKINLSNRDFFGGIRAVIPARTILIDYSFITKLNEAKSTFTLM